MSYLLINHAEDGRHLSVYKTEELARNELEAQIGRKVEGPITGRHFHDDWGRCFVVEKRPDNWSAKLEQKLADAFDARECGTASHEQIKLLVQFGW